MAVSPYGILDTERPLESPGRWFRVLPFALLAAAAIVTAAYTAPGRPVGSLIVAGLLVVTVVAATVLPWRRWPPDWQAAPVMGYFLVTLILSRLGQGTADFYVLSVIPVVWVAFFHRRWLMAVALTGTAAVLLVPLAVNPAAYPRGWGTSVLAFVAISLGGLTGQYLVHRTRELAAGAEEAEHTTRRDRDLFRAYLDTAANIMVVLDREGRIVLFNRYAEKVMGVSADQVIGMVLYDWPGSDPELFELVLRGTWPVHSEADVPTPSGRVLRVSWTGTGVTDGQGTVTHVVSTGLDITAQREAELRLSTVLEAVTELAIYAVDNDGVFTVFNVGAERMLGYRADELIGRRTIAVILTEHDTRRLAEEFGIEDTATMSVGDRPVEANTMELELVRADGATVPVALSFNQLRQGGRVRGYVAVARDITAERAAAEATERTLVAERAAANRLREIDQAKSDFLATVSHDLRTPLASIVGYCELLLDGDVGELADGQRRAVAAVERNSRRLEQLVGDLLTLSRIESGSLRLEARPVVVQQVVDRARDTVTGGVADDVHLTVRLPPEQLWVSGDPHLLERVVTNLLSNAFKFTPAGGEVELGLRAEDAAARLWVSDSGVGIPEEELSHVFERFYRSSRTRHEQKPGSGLGLAIAKSIVEQHGGSIRAEANPDTGTTFTVMLPLHTAGDSGEQADRPVAADKGDRDDDSADRRG